MLIFDNKKKWYENNKELLRDWEASDEFKTYRNLREKLRKLECRIIFLDKGLEAFPKRNSVYLNFYRSHLNELRQEQKKLFEKLGKAFKEMQNDKILFENKWLKQKFKEMQQKEGK